MKWIFLMYLLLSILLISCHNTSAHEKMVEEPAAAPFDVVDKYFDELLYKPKTQKEVDKNAILNYLMDKNFNFEHTSSGIYYTILEQGNSKGVKPGSMITAHYKGMLLDDSIFDSSYKKGQPFTFKLDQVIKGWQEVIPMLTEGGAGRFIIPSHLAYGGEGIFTIHTS